jgi:hypothetical protein
VRSLETAGGKLTVVGRNKRSALRRLAAPRSLS